MFRQKFLHYGSPEKHAPLNDYGFQNFLFPVVLQTLWPEIENFRKLAVWNQRIVRIMIAALFQQIHFAAGFLYQIQNKIELAKHALYICIFHKLLMFKGLSVFMLYILPNLRPGHEPAKFCCRMPQTEVVGYIFFLFGSSKRQFQTADIIGPKFLL